MNRTLQLLAAAVLTYVGYEAVAAYFRHRQTTAGPAGAEPTGAPVRPLGTVGGAAMTGGGTGVSVSSGRDDTLPNATRVGRGVR